MRWHVRAGHLQYLHSLDTDAAANDGDFGGDDGPGNDVASNMLQDALPCDSLRAGYPLPKPAGYLVREAQYTDYPGTMYYVM